MKYKFKSTFLLLIIFGIVSCSGPNGSTSSTVFSSSSSSEEYIFDFQCQVPDISLRVGETQEILYTLTPIGTASDASYSIISGNDIVSIKDGKVTANKEGEALIKALITSKENAKHPFSFEKQFAVNVSKPQREEGNNIDNGSFEYDLYKWNLLSDDANKQYNTYVFDQTPHSGEAALNLWARSDGGMEGDSDYLDLSVSQIFTVTEETTYLYSLWFKGDIDSIDMSILEDDIEIAKESFDATKFGKLVAEKQNGYAQYGIECNLAKDKEYRLVFYLKASRTANWGFIDDVAVRKGTIDDLIRPENIGDDEHNFVLNPNVETDLSGIVNLGDEITRATTNGTFISAYGATGGSYEFYQEVHELPDLTYRSSIRLIGSGEYTATTSEAYFYISDSDGNILFKQDFVIPNYEWTRISINDIKLPESVRLGVKVVASTRVWFGVTDFRLFSEGYIYIPSSDTSLTDIRVCDVLVDMNKNPYTVVLEDNIYENLLANKADCLAFVSGKTYEKSKIDMAIFDSSTGMLTITVKAEDGSTKEYVVEVIKKTDYVVWEEVAIPNYGFEDYFESWNADNLDTEDITTSGGAYEGNRKLSAYGKLIDTNEYGFIYQNISGFKAGDKVRLSCYISTYYNSQGAKSDVTSSIRLHIGNNAKEMDSVSTKSSSYYLYSSTYTLTASDVNNGNIVIGLSFKQAEGKNIWLYADAFKLEKGE